MSFDFFQSECALVHYREEQRLAKKALVSSTILLYLNKFLHYSLQPGKNWQHVFLYSLTSKRSILYFRMHNEPWICCTNFNYGQISQNVHGKGCSHIEGKER